MQPIMINHFLGQHAFLSNFAPSPMNISGKLYPMAMTTEAKTQFNKLFEVSMDILDDSPEVKMHLAEKRLLAGRFASRFIRFTDSPLKASEHTDYRRFYANVMATTIDEVFYFWELNAELQAQAAEPRRDAHKYVYRVVKYYHAYDEEKYFLRIENHAPIESSDNNPDIPF